MSPNPPDRKHRLSKLYEPSRCLKTAWVFNDQVGTRQSVFQALGYRTTHYQHDLHSKGHVRYLLNKLDVDSPSVLWIRLGGPNCGSGNKHDTLRAEHLCAIAERQQQAGRLVVIEASSRNLAWNLRSIQRYVERLQVTDHAWCHHETLCVSRTPCNSLVRIAANVGLQARFCCKCPVETHHTHMRSMSHHESEARYSLVLRSIIRTLLQAADCAPEFVEQPAQVVDAPLSKTTETQLMTRCRTLELGLSAPMHTQPESVYAPHTASLTSGPSHREDMLVSFLNTESENHAKRARLDAQFDFQTCLRILSLCKLRSSAMPRAASRSLKTDGSSVYVFGLYKHGSYIGITNRTFDDQELVKYLNAFCKHHQGQPPWTSFALNDNVQIRPHRDSRNLTSSQNQLIGLGNYKGGGVWIELNGSELQTASPKVVVHKQLDDGREVAGRVLSCKHRMISFNPNSLHCTEDWSGHRVTIALYNNRAICEVGDDLIKILQSLGFPCDKTRTQTR